MTTPSKQYNTTIINSFVARTSLTSFYTTYRDGTESMNDTYMNTERSRRSPYRMIFGKHGPLPNTTHGITRIKVKGNLHKVE